MKILISEDDRLSRRLLEAMLVAWGYEVSVTGDGVEALEALQQDDAPSLAVLDWSMPRLDGIEVCKMVRQSSSAPLPYIVLLTAREGTESMVEGLNAGADDYVTKPFDPNELHARIQVGARVVKLQSALAERVRDLEEALTRIKRLHGLLPICSSCKKIRDDGGYWNQIELYIGEHSDAEFSHSICPACVKRLYPEFSDKIPGGGDSE